MKNTNKNLKKSNYQYTIENIKAKVEEGMKMQKKMKAETLATLERTIVQ